MTEPLAFDRFRDLADIYGAAVARWPEPVRAAARRMATEPAAAAVLDRAATLDTMLDTWRVAAPDRTLHDRVTRTAPGARLVTPASLWWSGIGIAAALAGAAAGAAAVAAVASADTFVESNTSFGDLSGQET